METREELDTHLADLERRIDQATEEFYDNLMSEGHGAIAQMWMFN